MVSQILTAVSWAWVLRWPITITAAGVILLL